MNRIYVSLPKASTGIAESLLDLTLVLQLLNFHLGPGQDRPPELSRISLGVDDQELHGVPPVIGWHDDGGAAKGRSLVMVDPIRHGPKLRCLGHHPYLWG